MKGKIRQGSGGRNEEADAADEAKEQRIWRELVDGLPLGVQCDGKVVVAIISLSGWMEHEDQLSDQLEATSQFPEGPRPTQRPRKAMLEIQNKEVRDRQAAAAAIHGRQLLSAAIYKRCCPHGKHFHGALVWHGFYRTA